jgi:glycosyltransferase involved in cell wall biosynthesis
MKVVHLNFSDFKGGAARIMGDLIRYHSGLGIDCKALVARQAVPGNSLLTYRKTTRADIGLKLLHKLSVYRNRIVGDTYGILQKQYLQIIKGESPDIIHIHNLHGGWFALALLNRLQEIAPVVWTLHDEWAYTGHCVATMECGRYETGCGRCPDLKRMVRTWIDTTSASRVRKQRIYSTLNTKRFVISPVSEWVNGRLLRSGVYKGQAITVYNGVDTTAFTPENKQAMRRHLGIPETAGVVLFCSTGGMSDPMKRADHIIMNLGLSYPDLYIISLGQPWVPAPTSGHLIQPGYIDDRTLLCRYYSASDLLIYPSRADTFGLAVAESMACGTPALAFRTGGIPEIITDQYDGWLVEPDIAAEHLLQRIHEILENKEKLAVVQKNAVARIKAKFTLEIMGDQYLKVYKDLL